MSLNQGKKVQNQSCANDIKTKKKYEKVNFLFSNVFDMTKNDFRFYIMS